MLIIFVDAVSKMQAASTFLFILVLVDGLHNRPIIKLTDNRIL